MTDYLAVIPVIRPGEEFSLLGNDYETLMWHADSEPPTQAECDAAWPKVEYDRAYAAVEQERHAAYIADVDPLFFKWQRGTGTEQAWLDAVQAVNKSGRKILDLETSEIIDGLDDRVIDTSEDFKWYMQKDLEVDDE